MSSSETEMTVQRRHMNPAVAENVESSGNISTTSTEQARGVVAPKQGRYLVGLCNNGKKNLPFWVQIASLVFNVISTIFCIVLLGRSGEVLPTTLSSPSTPTECCPDGWVGYQRKCYYFSDSYRNWTDSQNYCASFNASLVVIDSQEEMSFLRRFKGLGDHWIGLQRIDDKEPWKWIDGIIFNNWFEILGRGECAYINDLGVASSSGQSEEPWICSKPVHR